MLPSAWLKALWLMTQLAALAVGVSNTAAGVAIAACSMIVLALWSAVAAVNVRRARPRTIYSRPPGALTAASSWFAPFVVVVGAVVVSGWIEDSGETTGSAGDDRVTQIRILVIAAAAIPFLIALYLPYGLLGRATAWAGGNRRHWQYFFVLPLLTSLLAGLVNRLLTLIVGSDSADDTVAATRTAALVLFVGLVLLPLVLAWVLGWRAMSETEHAARMTWERRNFPEGELDLSDDLVARAVVATYLASHPDG